jgi:4-hydroxybenzoate polyprenyltransferase
LGFSYGGNILEVPGRVYLMALAVMGVHSLSTVMDYTPDKQAGYRTFAVAFGKRAAAFATLIAFVAPRLFGNFGPYGNDYLEFCSVLALLLLIFPSEVLAKILLYSIFLVFCLGFVVIGYQYNWVY